MNDPTTIAPEQESRGFPVAFAIGIVAVLLLLGGVWWFSSRQAPEAAPAALAFGDAEQAYARRIEFSRIQMSRAKNFLGHEVTVIAGIIDNLGNQDILEMTFRIEFRDFESQVVFKDDLRFPDKMAGPIGAGRTREFQFNFENIPPTWAQSYPQFHITGLRLQQ